MQRPDPSWTERDYMVAILDLSKLITDGLPKIGVGAARQVEARRPAPASKPPAPLTRLSMEREAAGLARYWARAFDGLRPDGVRFSWLAAFAGELARRPWREALVNDLIDLWLRIEWLITPSDRAAFVGVCPTMHDGEACGGALVVFEPELRCAACDSTRLVTDGHKLRCRSCAATSTRTHHRPVACPECRLVDTLIGWADRLADADGLLGTADLVLRLRERQGITVSERTLRRMRQEGAISPERTISTEVRTPALDAAGVQMVNSAGLPLSVTTVRHQFLYSYRHVARVFEAKRAGRGLAA